MPSEQWRAIPEYPNYEASDMGRIRSVINDRPYVLKPTEQAGYQRYSLQQGQYTRTAYGHVLVLEAWVSLRPSPNYHGSHIDGDRSNNRLENLVWETRAENQARKHEHNSVYKGSDHHNSKLNEEIVRDIRARKAVGESTVAIAREYGISRSNVVKIHNRESWKHVE